MRPFLKSILPLLAAFCIGCDRPASGETAQHRREIERYLQSLLDHKDYFALQKELGLRMKEISMGKALYLTAFIDNAFNRNAASTDKIRSLFAQKETGLSDTTKAVLLLLEEDNYFKTFQYTRAATVDSNLIRHYRHAMDSPSYANIQNTSLITHGLASVPAQQTTIAATATFPWKKDKIGLMEVPIRVGDSTWSAIFDTRANISSISASYAKKLGIRMLGVSYLEGSGATGNQFRVSLAVADSLWLGAILLQHVVFQVMPDEVLYLAPVKFQLNIIIGYPVIASLREIHVFRSGTMTIPAHTTGSTLNNLAMDGLDPVIFARVGKDTLCFQFDTGASGTDLYSSYFRKYKADVLRNGKAVTVKTGGAGGVIQQEIYRLDSLKFGIGHQTVTLSKVDVQIKPIPNLQEIFYGNMGQDLIAQFNEMILNFQDMYIDFK